ncbi:MAG TPA: xanthine dehydrogenase family protein molybdopterin-binding subunit [Candidatus Binataceae bacterium]|nr:xanthine dehydrogenase family protein molybdopterin-binding subunit [Candidatus Binataceae bacterium]
MKYIGAEITAFKSRKLVAGHGQYASDIYLDGMLYIAFLRSPHAHARIRRIDAGEARAVHGVAHVLTAEEVNRELGLLLYTIEPEGMDARRANVYALPPEKVRFVGEPVAVVVANDKYTARRAADLIEVDYEVLPPVVDCEAALEAGATLIETEWGDNLMGTRDFRSGDAERAFADADGLVEGRVKTHRYLGAPIEPRAYVASYDRFEERLTFWASTQHPHQLRACLADTLRLPEASVRVIQSDVGGAFGLKTPFYPDEALIAYLAKKLGRPVKWIEERSESFLAGGHAREERIQYEAAYRKDGKVIGLRVRIIADVGAPGTLQGCWQAWVTASCIPTVYKIPNCEIKLQVAVTNKCPWTPYRGFGKEAATFLMERLMDEVADATGIDPVSVRLANYIQPEEFPYVQVSGSILDSGNYPAAMARLIKLIDYENFAKEREAAQKQGRHIGIGISHELMPEGCTLPSSLISGYDGCTVRVTPSGDIKVLTGVTSPGTGNETGIAQIVADTLGADLERIFVVQGDTEICPFGLGNFSSRSILIGGAAAREAAIDIRTKMFKVASKMLEVMAADLEAEDGRIFVRDAPTHAVGFADVTRAIYRESYGPHALDFEPGLEVTRYYRTPNVYHQPQLHPFGGFSAYPSWPYGVAGCVVEVDADTGAVKILRYCYVHDSGRIVNPLLAEGTLHGGFAQGIGGAMYENLAYDDNGQLQTTTFYDYTIPTAVELPRFEVEHQETLSPFNPLGCKGVGESGVGAPLSAICRAVENALPELKLHIRETPLTPNRVWQAIEQARSARSIAR